MVKTFLFMIALPFLSCSKTNTQSEVRRSDSTSTEDENTNEYQLAAIYRDPDSDSLLADKNDMLRFDDFLMKGKRLEERQYGGGDCGGKFRKWSFEMDTLTIDKYDCGDYGFGNTEYVAKGDSLMIVRKFDIDWMVDSTGNRLNVTETIYDYSSQKATKRVRTKSIPGWKDFKINDERFETGLTGQHEYNELKKQLQDLVLKERLPD